MLKPHRTLAASGTTGFILLAVSLLAVFGPATPAQAQIDISGDWNFDVFGFGPEAVPCAATIEQTGATFTIDAECTNVGPGSFTGEINPETGDFAASGSIAGIPIEMAGTVAQDSETLEGTWDAGAFGFSGTLIAERRGPVQSPTPLPTLPAPVDLTGTWRIAFSGIFSGTCDAVIEQMEVELLSFAQCPILGTILLNGTLNQVTGEFILGGNAVDLEGIVAADGNTVTGTWSALGFGGSITGERVDDIDLIELESDWEVVLVGEASDTCTLEVEQQVVSASATLSCEELGSNTLEGTFNGFDGWLSLRGTLAETETFLSAQLSPDGDYLFGGNFSGGVSTTTLIGVPVGTLEGGIVLVDCRPDRETLAKFCGWRVGFDFSFGVHVVAAPAGGYTGIEVDLSWPEPLQPSSTPKPDGTGVAEACAEFSLIGSDHGASFACSFSQNDRFAGRLIAHGVSCEDVAVDLSIALDEVRFIGADTALGPPLLIDATIECFGPAFLISPPLLGDVNCSSEVNSIDAALVLQFDAGLLGEAPCESQADVNLDGFINSIDATLILQVDAGLIPRLPVL